MERLWPRTREEQLAYHTNRNDAPEFDTGQPGRIDLARFLVDKILKKDLHGPIKIVELGCGAGDISGPYSKSRMIATAVDAWTSVVTTKPAHEVHGYDVVPVAQQKCADRFPNMNFHLGPVEDQEPQDCDLLIMCEFLEHVDDPLQIVHDWLPRAKWAIIGHPLNEPNPPFETGHIWSYSRQDWRNWFEFNNHHVWEELRFPMGHWDEMILGHSCRKDQAPFA